ncbi:MAG TPA: DinB family protein [Chloroflexia bacterium]|nr:DinB family protein [Chloroflexia bacterium]
MSELTQPRPAATGPEKEMLSAFLDYHRAVLLHKVEGLSDQDLRRRPLPSAITLLGLVKHLAYVERYWFQMVFTGQEVEYPYSDDDPDGEWRVEPYETTEEILDLYRGEVEKSRQISAANDLEALCSTNFSDRQGSLRWIMLHMIEETARHNGHADLLRESIDGLTGD